jgi:hypothetical protein
LIGTMTAMLTDHREALQAPEAALAVTPGATA